MQIFAGILLLGILITFHELGHFLFAKWLGVRVLIFSVGFGPKLLSFTYKGTEYRLSAIPLGGYVKMFGDSPDEELSLAEKQYGFLQQKTWRKSLIAFAGPLFNFILPVILFFALFIGSEQVLAPKIGSIFPDGVAFKAGLKVDDTIIAINDEPMLSFNQVAQVVSDNPDKDLIFKVRRKVLDQLDQDEEIILTVRPLKKEINTALNGKESLGRIGIMPAIELPIVFVSENSPLKKSGLLTMDEIIKIDDQPISNMTELLNLLSSLKPGAKISFLRKSLAKEEIITVDDISFTATEKDIVIKDNLHGELPYDIKQKIAKTKDILNKDKTELNKHLGLAKAKGVINQIKADAVLTSLGLAIGDRIVSLDGEVIDMIQVAESIWQNPFKPHVLGVAKADDSLLIIVFVLPDDMPISIDSDMLATLGFTIAQVFKPGDIISRKVNMIEAFNRSIKETMNIALMTIKSLGMLISNQAPVSQLGGPIMLFDVAQKAAQKGLAYYIYIMCLISVNLGLLNLLPIPALDGGHLLLFTIESIQRKPLSIKTRTIVTQIGIAILLTFMALALFNDIMRFFR